MRICLAGAGALGSWIGLLLASREHQFLVCDDDRVGEENIGTSAYYHHQTGALKAICLAEMMYRKSRCQAEMYAQTLEGPGVLHRFRGGDDCLVIDTFDNVDARGITVSFVESIHIGVSEDRTGAVVWDEHYVLPEKQFERGHNPICTNALGAPILQMTAMVAVNIIRDYIATGRKRTVLVTEGAVIG